jgi:hypothetical protein
VVSVVAAVVSTAVPAMTATEVEGQSRRLVHGYGSECRGQKQKLAHDEFPSDEMK